MEIPGNFFTSFGQVSFENDSELTTFFQSTLGSGFPEWFNEKVANRDEWKNLSIVGQPEFTGFHEAGDALLELRPCSLLEILSYIAVIINETGGTFIPLSEKFGRAGHPGVAYLFDSFPITTRDGRIIHKTSYNQHPNRTAGSLFRDSRFNGAHANKALGGQLANTTDPVWDGTTYPQDEFPTSGKPADMGYILEADFFKFRGRGLIQSTWRSAYHPLVEFVQGYGGTQSVVVKFKQQWTGRDPDDVCTTSSTEDWDELFQGSELILPCAAVLQHAKTNGYLPLSLDPPVANGTGQGSVARMGTKISGDPTYGLRLRARVARIAAAMAPPVG